MRTSSILILTLSIVTFSSIYLLGVGLLTIFERKIFGLVQLRRSLSRVTTYNLYHFFLDFFKASGKGIYDFKMGKFQSKLIPILGVYLVIALGLVLLTLPINRFSGSLVLSPLLYGAFDGSYIFLKIILSEFFHFKFSSISLYKLRKIYIYAESLSSISSFLSLSVFSLMGGTSYGEIHLFSEFYISKEVAIVLMFSTLFIKFFILLVKSFRTPFDFLEIETECVGGLILEFYGIIFTLWMLLEYVFIVNGSLYSLFIVSPFYFIVNLQIFCITYSVLVVLFIFFIFLSKGVLIRSRFKSLIFTFNKIFFLFFMIVLTILIFFII